MKSFCLLMVLVAAAKAQSSFVIMAPKIIRPCLRFRAMGYTLGNNPSTEVTFAIKRDAKEIGSVTRTLKPNVPTIVKIKLPCEHMSGHFTLHVMGTEDMRIHASRSLIYSPKNKFVFVQTDKALYKPGDEVRCRIIPLQPNLRPQAGPLQVSVYDYDANQIYKWQVDGSSNGVVNRDFQIAPNPVLGRWKIKVESGGQRVEKFIHVAKYDPPLLPTFEVDVLAPSYILTSHDVFGITVKATNTFGQPVSGQMRTSVKLLLDSETFSSSSETETFHASQKINGEQSDSVSIIDLFQTETDFTSRILAIKAEVVQSDTGNVKYSVTYVKIFDEDVKLSFPPKNRNTFIPGLPFTAYLLVTKSDGTTKGIQGKEVEMEIQAMPTDNTNPEDSDNVLQRRTISVPDNGLAVITFDTPAAGQNLTLNALCEGVSAQMSLRRTLSDSFIQVSSTQVKEIQAEATIDFTIRSTVPLTDLAYQIIAGGRLMSTGYTHGQGRSEHTFHVKTTREMSPRALFIVTMVKDNQEILMDRMIFEVSGALQNEVELTLSSNETGPNEMVNFNVKAQPTSQVYLVASDQNLLRLKSGNDISATDVYNELLKYELVQPDVNHKLASSDGERIDGVHDVSQTFKPNEVVIITDATINGHEGNDHENYVFDTQRTENDDLLLPEEIGETWIWKEVTTDDQGYASFKLNTSNWITSWEIGAFAMSRKKGIGFTTKKTELKVSKQLHMRLNMPRSVIVGEEVVIEAIVFNLHDQNETIRDVKVESISGDSVSYCNGKQLMGPQGSIVLEPGKFKKFYIPLVPTQRGVLSFQVTAEGNSMTDVIKANLSVEPEGVEMERNTFLLVDHRNVTEIFFKWKSSFPDNDTVVTKITVSGDILGPSLINLNRPLRMPTGCGEQTMMSLATSVYTKEYFTNTGQTSDDYLDRALSLMQKGYQQELTFKHADGSFSAFGEKDESGSMLLTAYVSSTFCKASKHIFIDDKIIRNAIMWMMERQRRDGTFPEPGTIITKNIQSGTDMKSALVVSVLISLYDCKHLYADENAENRWMYLNVTRKALAYVETQSETSNDIYFMSMAFYALHLVGSNRVQSLSEKLEKQAIQTDDLRFWTVGEMDSAAADIEVTSYILLTYALQNKLETNFNIVKWLTEQRTSLGGFSSTQDTVVAFQALATYSAKIYSQGLQNIELKVQIDDMLSFVFVVNNYETHREQVDVKPKIIRVIGGGTGIALIQMTTLAYLNMDTKGDNEAYILQVNILSKSLNRFTLQMCTSLPDQRVKTGMVVAEIGLPSGFEADEFTLTKLDRLKRNEKKDRTLILYFDEMTSDETCVTVVVSRTHMVVASKPAAVRVYDYYDPANEVIKFYAIDELANSKRCDFCPQCA